MQNFNIVCFSRFTRSTRLQQPNSPDITTASADLHDCTSSQTIHSLTSSHLPLFTTSVQNPLMPFCCVLGKDTLWHFPLLGGLPVLNVNHISIKLQADSNILASLEAGRGNCLPYVLALSVAFLRIRRINIKIKIKKTCFHFTKIITNYQKTDWTTFKQHV